MFIKENELLIRLGFFFGIFALMALWELTAPRRKLKTSKSIRWFNNISITFINTILVRMIFPVIPIGMAYYSAERGWGVFNVFEIPELIAGVLT